MGRSLTAADFEILNRYHGAETRRSHQQRTIAGTHLASEKRDGYRSLATDVCDQCGCLLEYPHNCTPAQVPSTLEQVLPAAHSSRAPRHIDASLRPSTEEIEELAVALLLKLFWAATWFFLGLVFFDLVKFLP